MNYRTVCVSELKPHHCGDNVTDKFPNINWSDDVKIANGIFAILFQCLFSVPVFPADASYNAPALRYQVVAEYPHDTQDFTQGLILVSGRLLESTGLYGHSALVEKDRATGKTLRRIPMDAHHFGEGIAELAALIYQLTWRDGLGFIYDLDLHVQRQFTYAGEGWGLTSDGSRLILSDGSSHLRFLSPRTLGETGQVVVRDKNSEVSSLNELEYARGHVWANVWHDDRIAVIDPKNGRVDAWLDLSQLRQRFAKPHDWSAADHVLNGIAYDTRSKHFLVTGKCWPVLFEIAVDEIQ